jgi:peroxiredoxin
MTQNKKVILGETVEDFELKSVQGDPCRLSQFCDSIVVIVFWSAECPVSAEYDAYFDELPDRFHAGRVVVLGIDSNVNYDQDKIVEVKEARGVRFPVLRDGDSAIADRFGALTTPHVFIIDVGGRLVYEGAVDDRTWRQREPTVNHVDQALTELLKGEIPSVPHTQPYGCTIVRA